MTKVSFVLQLDKVGVPASAARMWLDTSQDDVLQAGEELVMGTIDGKQWVASCHVGDPSGTQFLIKFVAPKGTRWSFTATSDKKLYEVTDQAMPTTKESLAGRLA